MVVEGVQTCIVLILKEPLGEGEAVNRYGLLIVNGYMLRDFGGEIWRSLGFGGDRDSADGGVIWDSGSEIPKKSGGSGKKGGVTFYDLADTLIPLIIWPPIRPNDGQPCSLLLLPVP